jgi:THO complex subunit 2
MRAEPCSAPFFVIFWHLSMPDIAFAEDAYKRAIDRITLLEKDVSGWRATTSAAQTAQKDERARLKARIAALTAERDVQSNLVNTVNKRRLMAESSKWFGKSKLFLAILAVSANPS